MNEILLWVAFAVFVIGMLLSLAVAKKLGSVAKTATNSDSSSEKSDKSSSSTTKGGDPKDLLANTMSALDKHGLIIIGGVNVIGLVCLVLGILMDEEFQF